MCVCVGGVGGVDLDVLKSVGGGVYGLGDPHTVPAPLPQTQSRRPGHSPD